MKIIEEIQSDWVQLVDLFWLPSHTARNLRAMSNFTPEDACREVFHMWLDGGDELRIPRTWKTVIEVMGLLGNSRVGDKIRAALPNVQ